MNRKKKILSKYDLPDGGGMQKNKRALREALLLAHENRSMFHVFGNLLNNTIKNMSKLQKSFVFSALAIAVVISGAGIFGPSASSVAHANAVEIVNNSFERMVTLEKEVRATLERNFQERIQFRSQAHERYVSLKDFSNDELELRLEAMKLSLVDALVEAKNAPDLKVMDAEEMPISGFLGRAGRTFGFKMTKTRENFEERLQNLPEDICSHFMERAELREDMMPATFLVYTNSEGQVVTLGMNEKNEPVIKFIQPDAGIPPFNHGVR